MKIVITGALGHIGSYLIRNFPNCFDQLELWMIDDLSTQRYASLFNLSKKATYHFIAAKVQDAKLDQILQNANVVIHLAAMTDAAGTASNPELVYGNNLSSTQVIARKCHVLGVPLIFASTTSVYGSQDKFVDETCKDLAPQSPYASCKLEEEKHISELIKSGLKAVICRLGTIYGISQGMRFHTAVNKFCWQAVMNEPLTVWETALDQKRPYLDLQDACMALSWIIKSSLFQGEIYNIVTANHTVRDVVNSIKSHIPTLKINFVQHKIMNQLSYEVSNIKICKTGFVFTGNLQNAIKETIGLLRQANNI